MQETRDPVEPQVLFSNTHYTVFMSDHSILLQTAIEAAYEAGKLTLGYFRTRNFDVETKENNSPVTLADRNAEERIRQIVRNRFPEHSILGEEHGEEQRSDSVRWIIDPIDGTKSFIHGVPFYGTMIGIEVDGEASIGVVYMPGLNEMYYAARGQGTYLNGHRVQTSTTDRMSEAIVLCTSEKRLRERPDYLELCRRTKFQRTWGDCYGHMLVASGKAEIMLDPGMNVWDCAPLQVIVEEAGGVFTDWNGTPTIHGGSAISTNTPLRDELMHVLNKN